MEQCLHSHHTFIACTEKYYFSHYTTTPAKSDQSCLMSDSSEVAHVRPSVPFCTHLDNLARGRGRGGLFVWLGRNGSAKINIENNKIVKGPPPSPRIKGRRFVINTGLRPSFLPFYGLCDTWRLFRHRALFL